MYQHQSIQLIKKTIEIVEQNEIELAKKEFNNFINNHYLKEHYKKKIQLQRMKLGNPKIKYHFINDLLLKYLDFNKSIDYIINTRGYPFIFNYFLNECQTNKDIDNLLNNTQAMCELSYLGKYQNNEFNYSKYHKYYDMIALMFNNFELNMVSQTLIKTEPQNFQKICKIFSLIQSGENLTEEQRVQFKVKEAKFNKYFRIIDIEFEEDLENRTEDDEDDKFVIENILSLSLQDKTNKEIQNIEDIIAFILEQQIGPIGSTYLETLFGTPLINLQSFFNIINPIKNNYLLHENEVTELLRIYISNNSSNSMQGVYNELNKKSLYVKLKEEKNLSLLAEYIDTFYYNLYTKVNNFDNIKDSLFKIDPEQYYSYYTLNYNLIMYFKYIEKADLAPIFWYISDSKKTISENIEYFNQNSNFLIKIIDDFLRNFVKTISNNALSEFDYYDIVNNCDSFEDNDDDVLNYGTENSSLFIYKQANKSNLPIENIYFNNFKKHITDGEYTEQEMCSEIFNHYQIMAFYDMIGKDLYKTTDYSINFLKSYLDKFKNYDRRRDVLEDDSNKEIKKHFYKLCSDPDDFIKQNKDILVGIETKNRMYSDFLQEIEIKFNDSSLEVLNLNNQKFQLFKKVMNTFMNDDDSSYSE